jgi:plasmid maintenance system antidote protein VapI
MFVRLAHFFGTSEQFWPNLQANYEISLVKTDHAAEIELIEPRAAGHFTRESQRRHKKNILALSS